jgi:hypothetical protein
MNKVHGKTIFTQNKLSIHKLRQETCFLRRMSSFFPCRAQRKKNLFPNPCSQLLQKNLHMFS